MRKRLTAVREYIIMSYKDFIYYIAGNFYKGSSVSFESYV